MSRAVSPSLARQLGSLFESGSAAALSDRQLVERFIARRGPAAEAAFAAIVARHGPIVLTVCRQLLGDHHQAEDAFQAVFLVLARQARSIRDPELLASWLYGVALRTAHKARARIARRRQTDEEGSAMRPEATPATAAEEALINREDAQALHGEIERLPNSFRMPVLLCYFEGLTLDEAALKLNWRPGTLRSRLARAREKLRRGLLRRGVALPGGMLEASQFTAAIPPVLCESTTRAAIRFAAGRAVGGGALSAPAATLAREIIATMVWHQFKIAALTLVTMVTLAVSAGYATLSLNAFAQSAAIQAQRGRQAQLSHGTRAESRPPDSARIADPRGRMVVLGRVLDPEGKPVPNAHVMAYGALKQGGDVVRGSADAPQPLGQAACDAAGQFRLELPRLGSATHHQVGAVALAPGYGAGWASFDVDAEEPNVDIRLVSEQVVQGRLFDTSGLPAMGVRVLVEGIGRPRRGPGSLPVHIDGPHFWAGSLAPMPAAWPQPATTGPDGRFTIRGVGRGLRALLMAEAPRFARERLVVDTDAAGESKSLTAALQPARVITGRVTFGDTDKPVPGTEITVWAYRGGPAYRSDYRTDADGSFRANPFSTDRYLVGVAAPEGGPYLGFSTGIFPWQNGTLERRFDIKLPRGAVIRGKVVEEGSGRPVAGAALGYMLPPGAAKVPALPRAQRTRRHVSARSLARSGRAGRHGTQRRLCISGQRRSNDRRRPTRWRPGVRARLRCLRDHGRDANARGERHTEPRCVRHEPGCRPTREARR